MKQHITPEQLNELSEEQKERLREWWRPREGQLVVHYEKGVYDKAYENEELVININEDSEMDFSFNILDQYYKKGDCLPLLTIGQMIELIESKTGKFPEMFKNIADNQGEKTFVEIDGVFMTYDDELCDALWQAVKEVL